MRIKRTVGSKSSLNLVLLLHHSLRSLNRWICVTHLRIVLHHSTVLHPHILHHLSLYHISFLFFLVFHYFLKHLLSLHFSVFLQKFVKIFTFFITDFGLINCDIANLFDLPIFNKDKTEGLNNIINLVSLLLLANPPLLLKNLDDGLAC